MGDFFLESHNSLAIGKKPVVKPIFWGWRGVTR